VLTVLVVALPVAGADVHQLVVVKVLAGGHGDLLWLTEEGSPGGKEWESCFCC